jgi:hypothetical protein
MIMNNPKRDAAVKSLIERLNGLASGKIKPKDKLQGLTNELADFIGDDVVPDCFKYMESWNGFSGYHVVPIQVGECPFDDYHKQDKSVWSGEYGNKLKSLCKHLANEFKKEL